MSDDDLRARVAEVLPPHTEKHDPRNGPPYCDECSENAQNWVKWPCPAVVLRDAVLAALPRYEQVGFIHPQRAYTHRLHMTCPGEDTRQGNESSYDDHSVCFAVYRRLPTEGAQPNE